MPNDRGATIPLTFKIPYALNHLKYFQNFLVQVKKAEKKTKGSKTTFYYLAMNSHTTA